MLPRGSQQAAFAAAFSEAGLAFRCVSTVSALRQQLSARNPVCVAIALRDANDILAASVVSTLRKSKPHLPVVVCVEASGCDIHDLMATPALAELTVFVFGFDDIVETVTRAISTNFQNRAVVVIRHHVRTAVPDKLWSLVEYVAAHSTEGLTVDQVSSSLGVPQRTLANQVRRFGLPTTERLIGWMRILHAAWLRDEYTCSITVAAQALSFPSASALRHMVRRYTGMSLSELDTNGVSRICSIASFERCVLA